jgi:predicted RNA binding protein YcfA (HicA-like mRNA interferase family)
LIEKNGFRWARNNGHDIYVSDTGRHISVPTKLVGVIARRLIKENHLNTTLIK